MKKTKIILAALLMIILAATSVFAECVFKIEKVMGRPGDEVKVSITLSTDEDVNSIGLRDIEYDESVLTFKGFADYEEIQQKTDLCAFDNNLGTCAIGLEEAETFEGKICSLVFEISEDAEEGDYGIRASSTLKYYSNTIESRVMGGNVEVRHQLLGDLTLDDSIDINDALLLLQHSLFPDLYPIEYSGSIDFNCDGAVDLNDAILVLQHSLFPDLYPLGEPENVRDFEEGMVVTPADDAENFGTSDNIVFTFPEKVYTDEGEPVTADYVVNTFEISATSLSGTAFYFDSEVSEDGCTITLIPENDFNYSTKYFVKLAEGILTYADGTYNPSLNIGFTTEDPAAFDLIIPTDLDGEKTPKCVEDAETGEEMWYIYAWVDGKMKYVPVVTEDVEPNLIADGEIAEEYLNMLCTYSVDEDGVYTIKSLGYDVDDDETDIYKGVNKEDLSAYANADEFDGFEALNNTKKEDLQLYVDGQEGTITKVAGSRFNIPGFERTVDLKAYTKIIIRVFDVEEQEFTYSVYDASSFKKSLDDGVELTNVSYIVSNNPNSKSRENLVVLYAETTDVSFKGEADKDSYRVISDWTQGDDEDGLWRFYYDLYNPFTGEKVDGVAGTNAEKKASMLDENDALERGTIVELEDGLVNDEKAKFNKGLVTDEDLVYITEVDEAEGFFAVANYNAVTNNGATTCKDCVKDAVEDFDGEVKDFITHDVIEDGNGNATTFIEYDKNTAFSVITRNYKFEVINHWADGKMAPTTIEAIADADKSLLCYNDWAKDRNGTYKKGYADYVKAYVAVVDEKLDDDELPVADFVVVIVNKDEAVALDEGEDACGNAAH